MTPRVPWLLPANLRHFATGGQVPPRPPLPGGSVAVVDPVPRDREATDTRYTERFTPGTPLWVAREAIVLARLAEHGGDLPAHRTVHLGETR